MESSVRTRILANLSLCFAFYVCGVMLCMLGPTLLDLGAQTGSSIRAMGFVFTVRSGLYLCGSLVGGEMVDRLSNPYFILSAAFLIVTGTSLLVQLCTSIFALAALISMQGLCMGLLDTGGNVLVLRYWGPDCGPWMQALHFAFGLGAFTAPLIAEPFLAQEQGSDVIVKADGSLEVKWAYMIVAFMAFPMSAVFLYWGLRPVQIAPRPHSESPHSVHRRSGTYRNTIVALAFCFFFVYVGVEVGYGGYLFTYAVEYPDIAISKSQAAWLTSVFWGTFAGGRLLAIFLASRLSPMKLLVFDLVGSIAASVCLIIFHTNVTALWVLTGLLGLCIASVFPSGIHLIEVYIDVTGRVASTFVVGAALGEAAVPLLVSNLLSSAPESFLFITMSAFVLAAAVFVAMFLYSRTQATHLPAPDATKVGPDEAAPLLGAKLRESEA